MEQTDEQTRRWHERHRAGETWREIASDEGISRDSVRKRVARYLEGNPKPDPSYHPSPQFATDPPDEPDYDTLLKLCRTSSTIINSLDPVITHELITFDTNEPIGIIFTSCAHLGSRYTFYEAFDEIFKQVLDIPRLYWVSLGDDVEGFLPGFPDASAVVDQAIAHPKTQRFMLSKVLDQLADAGKLLCGCASQHGGDWIRKKSGDDPIKDMFLDRHVPYFDGKALVTLSVGGETYQVALAHEFPGNSQYNTNHAQRRAALFDFPSADVVVQGDKHKYAFTEMSLPPHEYDAGLRKSYMQYLVQVGTAKVGNDKYSIRGWSRGVLEWPILIFHADKHAIEYTRDLNRASAMLASERQP